MAGKGFGKSGPSINFNVPGLPKSSIEKLPHSGVAYFRDRPDQAVTFVERVREELGKHGEGVCRFQNIDIAQVAWDSLNISQLLGVLQEKAASTDRLKAFKCGFGDDVAELIESWLMDIPSDRLPSEIHLSHNKLTAKGMALIVDLLETKRNELKIKPAPIWFRIESNDVDRSYLEQLAAEGKLVYAKTLGAYERTGNKTAVISMPSLGGASSPAPAWPAQQQAWPAQQPQWPAMQAHWPAQQAPQQAWGAALGWGAVAPAKGAWPANGWAATPANGKASPAPAGKAASSIGAGFVSPAVAAARAAATGKGKAVAATVDRSRSPAPRVTQMIQQRQQGQPVRQQVQQVLQKQQPPPKKVVAAEKPLPPNWEKHHSDEFNIPFWWNSVTEESVWERPP